MARVEAEKGTRWLEEHGLLLAYTVKCLLVAGLLDAADDTLLLRLDYLEVVVRKPAWR